jgi:hypothetical protein
MNRFLSVLVIVVITAATRSFSQEESISVCSFNIQFLGNSKSRDNEGLAEVLKKYDVVVIQELLAPPYAGTFPDGKPFVPNATVRQFFERMEDNGYKYDLSEEDTGPGIRIHINSSATEWWVAFYRTNKVKVAPDLPSGFLSPIRAHNKDFDRVPYAFPFRTSDNKLDFVLISVHLEPGPRMVNRKRREHELDSIARWITGNVQTEEHFLIVGDMNIENLSELADAVPHSFVSLNNDCVPTNTNENNPKPYDHVLYSPVLMGKYLDHHYGFHVENLIDDMRIRWTHISSGKYPGDPIYNHNDFRKYYSDHNPVDFRIIIPANNN